MKLSQLLRAAAGESGFIHDPIPLSPLQRGLLTVGASVMALLNPLRGDLVAAVGDATGGPWLERLRRKMETSEEGRQVLRDRPIVTAGTIDKDYLESLPEGTFGKEYYNFMNNRSFGIGDRPDVRFVEDEELAYVMRRFRDNHDYWHTLTRTPTDVEGELALKWLEMSQTGLPVTILSALVGPLRLSREERQRIFANAAKWAYTTNAKAENLMTVYFEKHFEENIDSLRERLKLTPYPLGFREGKGDEER